MLSRPHPNDANQLRRTKSSSTVAQRRSSASSLIDPVAAKQHAIVAATVAYERAHGKENLGGNCFEQPVKVARRSSNRARRSEGEGSHFNANRIPGRQTSKRLSNASHVPNDNSRARRGAMSSTESAVQHTSHVRARSELPDDISRYADNSTVGILATPCQQIRRSKSMYNTSGHVRATTIDSISFAHTPRNTSISHTDETVSSFREQDEPITEVVPPVPPITFSQTAIYNVDEKLQKARDQHFQDLHKKRIRQRASFILTPFKKRNEGVSVSISAGNGVTYDNGPPLPAPPMVKEERKFSDEFKSGGSLRSKIRKVFRRSSTTPLVLPVQHVEASRVHYGEDLSDQSELPAGQYPAPKSIKVTPISSADNSRSASPVRSIQTTESRSRVTSWADSTASGTIGSRDGKALAVILEDAPQPAPSTRSRKFSSLGIFRRSRKTSAATVPESLHARSAELETTHDDPFHDLAAVAPSFQAGLKRSGTVYDTLPSQARRISGHSSRASFSIKPTIRSVPSDSGGNLSSRSCSSRLANTSTNQLIHHDESSSEEGSTLDLTVKRLRNRLQKARKEEPANPTADQIAYRVEKSNGRWKQPLESGRSIFYPRSAQGVSPKRHIQASGQLEYSPDSSASTPKLEPSQEPPLVARSVGVMSPSVYSQNTNSSPTRLPNDSAVSLEPSNRHAVVVGTAVVNPSQLAGKYSIGSQTKGMIPRLAKTSRDWKAWLSKEVQELEVQPTEKFTLSSEYIQAPSNSGHRREHAQVVDGEDVTIGHGTDLSSSIPIPCFEPLPIPRPLQHRSRNVSEETPSIRQSSQPPSLPSSRPRLKRPSLMDRPSSRMNERFPFIETKRPPSGASRRSSRKSSPPQDLPPPFAKKENPNSSSMLAVPVSQPRRPTLRKPTSTSSFQRSTSSLAQYTTNTHASASNTSINQIHRSTSHIPRPSAAAVSGLGSNKAPNTSSATDLLNRSTSVLNSTRPSLPKAVTAPPLALTGPNFDTDPTLAAIFKGPYRENSASPARPRALAVRKAPSHSQLLRQQSTPHMTRESSSTMPGESSSLRRAESSSILRDGQISTMLRAQSSLSMKENYSPARSLSLRENSAASTPTRGQVLAQRFLDERRFGGNSRQSLGIGESSPASPRFI